MTGKGEKRARDPFPGVAKNDAKDADRRCPERTMARGREAHEAAALVPR